jgi:histidinol-phosphate aminotransferase
MDRITEDVVIGTAREAADRQLLEENGIEAIVSLSSRAPDHDGLPVEHVPLSNGPGTDQATFDAAVDAVRDHIAAGRTVLVHCRQGVSRSVAVAAAAIAVKDGTSLREAINAIELERPQADPDRALIGMAETYLEERQ